MANNQKSTGTGHNNRNRPKKKGNKKSPRNRMGNPTVNPFDAGNYRSGAIYGANQPISRGYGVSAFNNRRVGGQNGRLINVKGETIDFYIEEIEANFSMAGTTAQSQKKRQFFPHNMVMPSVTVRGRAPNSFQYNRLATFVRVGQYSALSTQQLKEAGVPLRTIKDETGQYIIPTLRFIIRDGSGNGRMSGNRYPYTSKNVKGRHQAWKLEGYIKVMGAGAKRFDPAPAFEFEFMIAESQGPSSDAPNVGVWNDTVVAGNLIKPWMDIFKSRGEKTFERGTFSAHPVAGEDQVSDAIDDVADAIGDLFE